MKLGTVLFLQLMVFVMVVGGIYMIYTVSWKIVVGAFLIMLALQLVKTMNEITGGKK